MDRYMGLRTSRELLEKSIKAKEVESNKQIIAAYHKFLWDGEKDKINSVEKEIAKLYDDQFFKEYCIGDLSHYEKNKIALRWRTKKEVISGKGETICGNKECNAKQDMRSWEVNFRYVEHGKVNNALVKIRLCPPCSMKLNHHKKKKEVLENCAIKQEVIEPETNIQDEPSNKVLTESEKEVQSAKENSVWDSSVIPKMDQDSNEQMTAYLLDLFYLKEYIPNQN